MSSTDGPAEKSLGRFVALDSFRGLAAVSVVFLHIGDFGPIAGLTFFRHAYILVDFFFVLSGFVIAAAYGERIALGFSRRTFLFLRLGRIYPLHFVVIVVTAALLGFGGSLLVPGHHGMAYLVRAFLLLDGYVPGEDWNPLNAASWSISVELAAYGLAALLFGRGGLGAAVALAIWGAAVFAHVAGIDVPVFTDLLQRGIIGFGMGVATWALFRRMPMPKVGAALNLAEAALLVLALCLVTFFASDGWRLIMCDLAFAATILVFAHDRGILARLLRTAPMQALGRWSYSIYMIHLLVILLFKHLFIRILAAAGYHIGVTNVPGLEGIDLGPPLNAVVSVAIVALCIVVASQTYRMIEAPGRQWARTAAARRGAGRAEIAAPTM